MEVGEPYVMTVLAGYSVASVLRDSGRRPERVRRDRSKGKPVDGDMSGLTVAKSHVAVVWTNNGDAWRERFCVARVNDTACSILFDLNTEEVPLMGARRGLKLGERRSEIHDSPPPLHNAPRTVRLACRFAQCRVEEHNA